MNTINGFTLAIVNMNPMLTFYSDVFGIQFTPTEVAGYTLYNGAWNDLNVQFCPAALANNSAKQNRHQLTIEVNNLKEILKMIEEKGGKLMGEVTEDEKEISIGIYDPDNNSMVLKQVK